MKTARIAHQIARLSDFGSRASRIPLAMFVGSLLFASCLAPVQPTATPHQPTATPFSTAVADGITVAARNARVDGPFLAVDVCFDRPTDDDWTIEAASLQFDARQESLFEAADICAYGDPSCFNSRRRCDTLRFRLTRPGVEGPSTIEQFTIRISPIAAHPAQGDICAQWFLELLRRKLASREPRITVNTQCDARRELFLVTNKPADMSLEEAQAIVAEVYLEVIGRRGPWVLEGSVD